MKKKKTERLPIMDDTIYIDQKDWRKSIRAMIQDSKEEYSRLMNGDSRIVPSVLDLTPAMEKRRTEALISSLEKFPPNRQAYISDWIKLNVASFIGYAPFQAECHILTAASVWILDKLSELDSLPEYSESSVFSKLYTLLPANDELPDNFPNIDIWDCKYDKKLLASVEYVLYYRNKDIAPLESSGGDADRVLTSNLCAEKKDRADVPSRKNFEEMLSLIPQWMKDKAVKQFKAYYQAWCDRFFEGTALIQSQYTEKCNDLNAVCREINKLKDKIDEKAVELDRKKQAEKNVKKHMKNNKPDILMVKPDIANNIPSITSPPISCTVNGLPIRAGASDPDDEFKSLLAKLKELSSLHDKAIKAMNDIIDKRDKFPFMMANFIYTLYTPALIPEILSDMRSFFTQPIPVTDPYEICFAFLYLIETGSDIPWLYGSCLGMMSEVVKTLPWAFSPYEESKDPYWKELPPESSKTPNFPDWYSRDYLCKGDNEYQSRNLAQIVYETTGCLMPRDLHRYDAKLKELGRYGIKQNKAIAMLYCMNMLGNAKRQFKACNLETNTETYETSVNELLAEKMCLEKQIQQLRSALHTAEKSAEDIKAKLEQQKANAEAEHRELADLREIVFNKDNSENDVADEPADTQIYPYTVQKSTVVFGGHETWIKSLKPLLKGNIKFIAKEMKIDISLVRYADVVWIQYNAIPHGSYYRIVNKARKLGKPIRYFTNASAVKCAEQIVENDKRV